MLRCIGRSARLLRRRRPELILNWMPKTQLYGSPAAVLAGMRDGSSGGSTKSPPATGSIASPRCSRRGPSAATRARPPRPRSGLRPRRETFVVAPGRRRLAGGAARRPELPADGLPLVGLVGRLQPWKGQDRLLRAQGCCANGAVEIHTLIVGGDAHGLSPDYAASLPGLVAELGLAGAVDADRPGPRRGARTSSRWTSSSTPRTPSRSGSCCSRAWPAASPVVAVDSRRPGRVHRGRRHRDARALGRARRARRRARAAARLARAAPRRSARPGASGSCASSPTRRCASACSIGSRRWPPGPASLRPPGDDHRDRGSHRPQALTWPRHARRATRPTAGAARAGSRGDDRRARHRPGRRDGAPARRADRRPARPRSPGHGHRARLRAARRRRTCASTGCAGRAARS